MAISFPEVFLEWNCFHAPKDDVLFLKCQN